MSLSAWIYSALFGAAASLPLFGVSKYVPEGFLTGCSYDYLSDDLATRILVRHDVTTIPNSAATAGNQISTRRTMPIDNIRNNVLGNQI